MNKDVKADNSFPFEKLFSILDDLQYETSISLLTDNGQQYPFPVVSNEIVQDVSDLLERL